MRVNFSEIYRFSVVGILNTCATLAVIYALMLIQLNAYIANLIGYSVGLVISFTLNRRWTFRSRTNSPLKTAGRFLIAVLFSYLANIVVVHLLLTMNVSPYLAQVAGMPVYTVCFFVLSKFFVFKAAKDDRAHHVERCLSQ